MPPHDKVSAYRWPADGLQCGLPEPKPERNTVKTLLDENQLNEGVEKLAESINSHYGDKPLTIICILTGSIVLGADLIRKLRMPLRVGVLQTSSYQGTERGELTINSEMMLDIKDREVLLVDDIFDTGHTLEKVSALVSDTGRHR